MSFIINLPFFAISFELYCKNVPSEAESSTYSNGLLHNFHKDNRIGMVKTIKDVCLLFLKEICYNKTHYFL